MRSDEIFSEVMKNHGTNYRQYALSKGLHDVTYFNRRIKFQEYISGWLYMKCLRDFGCVVHAVRGNERREITDILTEASDTTRLHDMVKLVLAMGFVMVVVDGDREYELTSARIEEKHKEKGG